jgi:hypothetical protein
MFFNIDVGNTVWAVQLPDAFSQRPNDAAASAAKADD